MNTIRGAAKCDVVYLIFWHASAGEGVEGGGGDKNFSKIVKTVYIPFNMPSLKRIKNFKHPYKTDRLFPCLWVHQQRDHKHAVDAVAASGP